MNAKDKRVMKTLREESQAWKQLKSERDELLAALKRLVNFDGKYGGGEKMDFIDYKFNLENIQRQARAAIDKCKGA